ncbi:MAG: DUF1566 domain-containing protein [Candidatus Parabeggiatoa sp.]|nr:DUF1566 domain-containing protein [Candidatus Parabeggiatoa sp.]
MRFIKAIFWLTLFLFYFASPPVLADGKIRLAAGSAYVKDGNKITITNPTMYTGILVQYDKEYKDILAVDFIDGTTTSWFASKFTEPEQYLNIVAQTKALFTGDFSELAKLENWGTLGNFGAQVGALFTADIPELERLQSNTTDVQLSQYAYSADYYIGGWISLIVDAGKVVLSTVPSDQLKKDAKKDLRFRVLKEVLTNEVIVADIRGLLAENKLSDAVIKAMLEIGMSIFRNADLFISKQAVETIKSSILLELELKYGIQVVEAGLKGLNLVGSTLDGLQKLANFLDAGSLAVGYYFGDGFNGQASHITFKGIAGDQLEFIKMETLKTGDKWSWHSPERKLAIIIKPTTDRYQASNGYVCRDYDYQFFFADDGSNYIVRDELVCRKNDGTWVDADYLGEPDVPTTQPQPVSSSSNRYTDNGDGTVTDNRSGLIWLKNANCFGRQDWEMAMQSAANLASGYCGLSDGSTAGMWRLPTIKEWQAMVDGNYHSPTLSNAAGTEKWTENDAFSDVQSEELYWSSTTHVDFISAAWFISLSSGLIATYSKTSAVRSNDFYVWPVRGEIPATPQVSKPTNCPLTASVVDGKIQLSWHASEATNGKTYIKRTEGCIFFSDDDELKIGSGQWEFEGSGVWGIPLDQTSILLEICSETATFGIVQKLWYDTPECTVTVSAVPQAQTPPSSSNRYTDNGDGTVTDNRSGLIWLKNANCFGRQDWEPAMQSAANLASGQCDLSDGSTKGMWRLPTIDEWEAMVDKTYGKPTLSNAAGRDRWTEGDAFSGVQTNLYWSSTMNEANIAWYVFLYDGDVGRSIKTNNLHYVWPVRDSVIPAMSKGGSKGGFVSQGPLL